MLLRPIWSTVRITVFLINEFYTRFLYHKIFIFCRFALQNHHYEVLGKLVCKLFPTENLSIYYVDPKTEGPNQKISKGKIPDAYRNKLRILRNAEIIPRKRKQNDNISDNDDDSDKYGGKLL